MTAAGWYNAQGDPPGTTRYWDGEQWVGDAVHTPAAPSTSGVVGAPGGYGAQVTLAGPGARIGARVIDVIVTAIVSVLFLLPTILGFIDDLDALGPNPSDSQVENLITDAFQDNAAVLLIIVAVGLLWDFLWVGLFGGTPGKLMLGLRVARPDNGAYPPGWGKAALRALNRLVGFIPGLGPIIVLLVGLVSLILLFVDDKHRTVMDRIASTVVIKK